MARVVQLELPFWRASHALSNEARQACTGVVRSLSTDDLPGRTDFETLIKPAGVSWARRVPGFQLWIVYDVDAEQVRVHALLSRPPTLVE